MVSREGRKAVIRKFLEKERQREGSFKGHQEKKKGKKNHSFRVFFCSCGSPFFPTVRNGTTVSLRIREEGSQFQKKSASKKEWICRATER